LGLFFSRIFNVKDLPKCTVWHFCITIYYHLLPFNCKNVSTVSSKFWRTIFFLTETRDHLVDFPILTSFWNQFCHCLALFPVLKAVLLQEIFESQSKLFIVMSLVRAGDLFDRIIARKRFPEKTALVGSHKYLISISRLFLQILIWRLLSAIKYLHDRGIVHRGLQTAI